MATKKKGARGVRPARRRPQTPKRTALNAAVELLTKHFLAVRAGDPEALAIDAEVNRLLAEESDGKGKSSHAPTVAAPRMPRARDVTDHEIRQAVTYEARGLICARILALGLWTGHETETRLAVAWGIDRPAVRNYRRTGAVACAAARGDVGDALEDTIGALRRQEADNEAIAVHLEGRKMFTTATRYRDLAHKARVRAAEILGLVTHRHSVSLESDPRIAGMYSRLLEALEDFDRMRLAYVAEVEQLTGGPLPQAPLPSASEHVRDAVRRYEAEIGARSLGPKS